MFVLEGLKLGAILQWDKIRYCYCTFTAKTEGVSKSTLGKIQKIDDDKFIDDRLKL